MNGYLEYSKQGILSKGEGSVQLTSSLSYVILLKTLKKFY